MNPMWLQLILLAMQDTPAVVAAIQVANLPAMTGSQMQTLQDAMDAAAARADADVAKKFPQG